MNKREQRIEELWELYDLPKSEFERIFNEGYILGYEVALLPREENKDDNR